LVQREPLVPASEPEQKTYTDQEHRKSDEYSEARDFATFLQRRRGSSRAGSSFGRRPKLRNVRPKWKVDNQFVAAAVYLIILGETLPHLSRCNPHNGVSTRLVAKASPEHVDCYVALFQLRSLPLQSAFHHVTE
jgi:hypothetical protein